MNSVLDTEARIEEHQINQIRSTMNSYLGILRHSNSHSLVIQAKKRLCPQFFFFFSFNAAHTKVVPNYRNLLWHYTQPCLSIKSLMTC